MRWRALRFGVVFVGAAAAFASLAAAAEAAVVQSKPSPLSWQANGRVLAIEYSGNTIYIGGKFTSVRPPGDPAGTGEVARNHVAAFNATTGNLLQSWNPNTNGTVDAILPTATGVYLGGASARCPASRAAGWPRSTPPPARR
jgi:hypothetical protein